MNKIFLKRLLTFLLLSVLLACKKEVKSVVNNKEEKPNILIIVVDDAGFMDFGFMGSRNFETPNIDDLATRGVIFTDAHVTASVCAPSRAGLITGKYQQRFGFEANGTGDAKSGEIGLADEVLTIANVFKQHNYKTIALGKWHLGSNSDDHPNQRGFDEFYGFLGGSRSYFPIKNPSKLQMLQHNGEKVNFQGYLTDALGDKAVKYVEENSKQPFLMYLSFNAVHTPMHAKKEHLEKYKSHPRKKLAAMTWSLDENIGKLVTKLKETNQLENTLIFFLSDNGGAHNNHSNNGPLKGCKGNKFEGGHRVPFFVSWGAKIKSNQIFDGLSSSLDIFATSITAAGIKNNLKLDGVDLLPYIKGSKKGSPHKSLFWRKLNEAGARIGDYKLVRLQNYGSTLYNLKEDLGEMNDLTLVDRATSATLNTELSNWEKQLMQPLWREGDWEPVTYHIQKSLMLNAPILYRHPKERKQFLKKQNKN